MQLNQQIFSKHLPDVCTDLYSLKQALYQYHLVDDTELVFQLTQLLDSHFDIKPIKQRLQINRQQLKQSLFAAEAFFSQLDLFSAEGNALMRLAEAFLRIQHKPSAIQLIQDKLDYWQIAHDNIQNNSTESQNKVAVTLHKLLELSHYLLGDYVDEKPHQLHDFLQQGLKQLSAPAIYLGMRESMQQLAQHFVYAQNNHKALARAQQQHDLCTFDCLGEAALGEVDTKDYFDHYHNLIHQLGQNTTQPQHSVSIKLSALHGRFGAKQYGRIKPILLERVLTLAFAAKQADVGVTFDAEEADKLMITLDIFANLRANPKLENWHKLGIAVQAYSKRALITLLWLNALGRQHKSFIPVRLVKGAYWDSEIKQAQQQGLNNYPVFRQKQHTDLSYLVCARFLINAGNAWLKPQFAGHNIITISQIEQLMTQVGRVNQPIEWQKLYGMGSEFFSQFAKSTSYPIRQYAPVGNHKTVLPYLIRRLLENGANQSFVHQIADDTIALDTLLNNVNQLADTQCRVKNPPDIFTDRKNSSGVDLSDCKQQHNFDNLLNHLPHDPFFKPIKTMLAEHKIATDKLLGCSHIWLQSLLCHYASSLNTDYDYPLLFNEAAKVQKQWRNNTKERIRIINNFAKQLVSHQQDLLFLLVYEAGKTRQDALNEWREALDFCYYYTEQIKRFSAQELAHTAGEKNTLTYQAKGTFVCISPWNFPLAIFLGQVVAALITGNTVIAKPASSTQLISHYCLQLFSQAGLPNGALQLLTGPSKQIANKLLNYHLTYSDNPCYLSGVCFTGSNSASKHVNQQLLSHPHSVKLIAETGGINIMLADASALVEQVVRDVIESAFASAGQRCSATRILVVHQSIYVEVKDKLQQAMAELVVGEAQQQTTDVAAVINQAAKDTVNHYLNSEFIQPRIAFQSKLPNELAEQIHEHNFVPPTLVEIDKITQVQNEIFAPVLHICPYQDHYQVLKQMQTMGYGLTMAVHTRNQHLWQQIALDAQVGNIYINRNQVGAVVGCQAFGGMNLSGTGPKAGGPNYLSAFLNEKLICENTAAIGGSLDLYD
ncbi:bifunctional proline dehydrogenase/L-glutamate gamma-semialdehyde dehydrogenase PutA [Catenovulum agarivorans]|uniref:bifunctional proline dehydrogenase/L-glutamate gamma-semialdehyde dehydrogenase PutA n=1 Tax=Catenovulum agarivorans TaxID=1172192 RepID=UPI0002ED759A|nr:bifunctional proline dehydrogenase/L-glutamate gamma-semialdehyde dehydrogenase PutA [Catenovulum agarivorans]